MIVGTHLIWTIYGSWLPNDPRGSNSHEIRVESLAELGELHHGRKRVQPPGREIREFYDRARPLLKHPILRMTHRDVEIVAQALGESISRYTYTCYACAIMPDHVHMLIRAHRDRALEMIRKLQKDSRDELIRLGRRDDEHPVWGGPGWKVFLNTCEDIERTEKYIRENPTHPQSWKFVKPYNGWLPRPLLKREHS